jgi:hypothetical protein
MTIQLNTDEIDDVDICIKKPITKKININLSCNESESYRYNCKKQIYTKPTVCYLKKIIIDKLITKCFDTKSSNRDIGVSVVKIKIKTPFDNP